MQIATVPRFSSLEAAATRYGGEHFIDETVTLLKAVVDRDLDGLLSIEDEDFVILDFDPRGDALPVRSQPEWAPSFKRYSVALEALDASSDIKISDYRSLETSELGYSVVDFRNTVEGPSFVARFDCTATIIWKDTEDGWKEAHWHCSVVDQDVRGDTEFDIDLDRSTVAA